MRRPSFAIATARFTATVDLPTPPFCSTAMTCARDRGLAREGIAAAALVAAGDAHDHVLDARLAPERRLDARPQCRQRFRLLGAGPEVDLDDAAGHAQVGHHAERHDVAPVAREKHGLQCVVQALAAGLGHARRLASTRHKGKGRPQSLTLWARSR
jgi:hypothetical protein